MNNFDFTSKELEPIILEVIEKEGSFRLFPKGESMRPTICQGEDSVLLVAPKNLKKYDIIFYKRPNGQNVIHRIIKIKGDSLTLSGDNQFFLEEGVKKDSVIAKVGGIYKGERLINVDKFGYRIKSFLWVNTKPLRRGFGGIIRRIKKCLIFKGK